MYPFSIYFTAYFISSITPLFSLYTLLAITVFRIEMYKEMTTKILFQFLIGNVYRIYLTARRYNLYECVNSL